MTMSLSDDNQLSPETRAILAVVRRRKLEGETSPSAACAAEVLRVLDNLKQTG